MHDNDTMGMQMLSVATIFQAYHGSETTIGCQAGGRLRVGKLDSHGVVVLRVLVQTVFSILGCAGSQW